MKYRLHKTKRYYDLETQQKAERIQNIGCLMFISILALGFLIGSISLIIDLF